MKRIKRIKNEAKHNQFLKVLEAVNKNYRLLPADKIATAMSGIINIVATSCEFGIEQLKQGIEFNDTELGHLVACLFEYLNEHPALLEVDGFLESAEDIANDDDEGEENLDEEGRCENCGKHQQTYNGLCGDCFDSEYCDDSDSDEEPEDY